MKQENESNDIVTDIIELIDFEEILEKQIIRQSKNSMDLRDNWLALYGAIFSEQFAEEGKENRAVTHSLSMMLVTRRANDDNYNETNMNNIKKIESNKESTTTVSTEVIAKRKSVWNNNMNIRRNKNVRSV